MSSTEPILESAAEPSGAADRSRAVVWSLRLSAFAGLLLLLAANYFLRHTLEHGNQYIYSFFTTFYAAAEKVVFSAQHPWWKLFLPEPMFTGGWITTTLILTHFVELRLTPPVTWYLFNAILITSSFLLSWHVFRSLIFSYTFAICFGFGTQLYHTYAVTGAIGFCLLFVYYQALLVCIYRLITTDRRRALWWVLFGCALLVTALAYEGWLDFLVFVWIASAYLTAIFLHTGRQRELWRMVTVVAVMTVVGGVYVYVKSHFGYGQTLGSESDVVFNYKTLAPAVEDVISNVFTHLYIVLTMFLPPVFVSSTSLLTVGADQLVADQYGYHAPFLYLVPMHHVFLWRYYAGIAFAIFAYALVRCLRKSWIEPKTESIVLCVFMLMVAIGGPTHDFIKFRPMNSMPHLGYHVMVGNLGMALLIAYGLTIARKRIRNTVVFTLILIGAWGTVFYSALARPAFLSQAAAQGGLGDGIYPDPWQSLTGLLGTRLRALETGGRGRPSWQSLTRLLGTRLLAVTSRQLAPVAAYRLVRYQAPPDPGLPHFDENLPPLPELLPLAPLWTYGTNVSVVLDPVGYEIQGNDTQAGRQLSSPPFAVQPHQQLLIRIVGKVDQGQICVGVLGDDGATWVFPPTAPHPEYVVDTGESRHVNVVIANCYPGTAGNLPTKWRLRSASYAKLQTSR